MSQHSFDLDAFRERIGYAGPLAPTLEVLDALQLLHVCAIPFENLSVLQGEKIDLEPSALEKKLIRRRRGGYCFEQNGLMLGVLRQIGFEVTPLAGRVRLDRPREVLPPRTHLFLKVTIANQTYIYDAGVGNMSLTSSIRLDSREEQPTRHETRRIIEEEGKFFHQAWTGDSWMDVYEFTGEEMPEIDREVSNWWTSTSPNAKFSQNLMASIATPNGERMAVANDRFTRRRGGEVLETFILEDAEHLLTVLREHFGLDFPSGTRFGEGAKPWPN